MRSHVSTVVAIGLFTVVVVTAVFTQGVTRGLSATLPVAVTLQTSGDPFDIAIDTATNRAFVPDSKENVLYVFDLATAAPIGHVPTGRQPNHVVLSGARAYVSNFTDATITVVDTITLEPIETLPFGGLGLATDPKSGLLYAAAGGRLFVLDTAKDALVSTIDTPAGANVWGLALDPSRGRLYGTDIANPRVLVFDTSYPRPSSDRCHSTHQHDSASLSTARGMCSSPLIPTAIRSCR